MKTMWVPFAYSSPRNSPSRWIFTEVEAPALETAVKAASAACDFVPELTEQPAEGLENWLLLQK